MKKQSKNSVFSPATEEATVMTDIHLRVTQETGELTVYNDDDVEITRSVIEQWIDNKDDDFYHEIAPALRKSIEKHKQDIEQMSILKPFSFVLEQDDKEAVEELYLVDDDTVIIDPDLMQGLDEDLLFRLRLITRLGEIEQMNLIVTRDREELHELLRTDFITLILYGIQTKLIHREILIIEGIEPQGILMA